MTPEELDAARTAAKGLHAVNGNARTSIADVFDAFLEHVDSQAEQIKRLEADLAKAMHGYEYARFTAENYFAQTEKQRAALKKLGEMCRARGEEIKRLEGALIEERKNRLPTAPDAYWSCRRDEAERQLRAEGVIR